MLAGDYAPVILASWASLGPRKVQHKAKFLMLDGTVSARVQCMKIRSTSDDGNTVSHILGQTLLPALNILDACTCITQHKKCMGLTKEIIGHRNLLSYISTAFFLMHMLFIPSLHSHPALSHNPVYVLFLLP
jgi:hypothetical protein